MKSIDLALVQRRLFENRSVRNRIARDYGLAGSFATAEAFARAVVDQLDQVPAQDPLGQTVTNAEVFRASVRSVGSNSRSWATFLRSESRLLDLLSNYDPEATQEKFDRGALTIDDLKACLPGQSSSADARAIRAWAHLLCEIPNYYRFVQRVGLAFRTLSEARTGAPLPDSHLLLCLVGYLGNPSRRWPGESLLAGRSRDIPLSRRKLPGMAYVLASEFFRNLRWNGFKPDRHVQRLFSRWSPTTVQAVQDDVQVLLDLIGRRGADLRRYLTYALVGIAVTPEGFTCSYVDNLVWLLGAYVEKKGRESDLEYIPQRIQWR